MCPSGVPDRTIDGLPEGWLHLRPRSRDAQRVWHIGSSLSASHAPGEIFQLAVLPDRHDSFASLESILQQLEPFAGPDERRDLARLDGYMREACPNFGDGSSASHGRFMADAVTLAIMRRISRESVYTARLIETGARVLNSILSGSIGCKAVCVADADRLDRPTLKVLARAMLLLEPSHGFAWIWQLSSDPTRVDDDAAGDPYVASRNDLLRKRVGILSPTLVRDGTARPLRRPATPAASVSPLQVAAALVVQNYDACFLGTDALVKHGDFGDISEGLRLRALAAVNVGNFDLSMQDLHEAERATELPGRRAHFCYLQGLIDAKRRYSLEQSRSHYERGLAYLDAAAGRNGHGEDLPLERGWLLNGLALNQAILQRRHREDSSHHDRAIALERQAFGLVQDGDDPSRSYLRFNLLANCALLMEMQGHYDVAIDIFTKTFDFTDAESPTIRDRSRRALGYRAGVLHYRAGRVELAHTLLQDAVDEDGGTDGWPTYERVLRAVGSVALARGAVTEAADIFGRGLDICRRARSAEGTREHARGLCSALMLAGKLQQARSVFDMLSAEEGVTVGTDLSRLAAVTPPSPKLPAYVPEVDLEGIPAIDINRFLGDALSPEAAHAVPWQR